MGDIPSPKLKFRIPAPVTLVTKDDEKPAVADTSLLSPSSRRSSAVASSPRASSLSLSGSLLNPHGAQSSGANSPRTPAAKFEDPLMAMPSFKRGVDPASTARPSPPSAMPNSPSFRAGLSSSNSFSARRISIDFRRSLPGGQGVVVSTPGEARASGVRGTSDFGGEMFPHVPTICDSPAMSEHGHVGDDDEATEQEVDAALQMLGRRHSFFPIHDSASPTATTSSRGLRNSMRVTEDEDFMHRLQQNRTSWKERSRGGSLGVTVGHGGGGSGSQPGSGEGLQNQTHAALEQLRGELKSLSMRSMHGGVVDSKNAPGIGVGGGSGGGSGGIGHPPHSGPGSAGTVSASAVPQWGGGGSSPGGAGSSGDRDRAFSRISDGQTAQLSPSRLSISNKDTGGGGAGEHLLLQQAPSPLRNSMRVGAR